MERIFLSHYLSNLNNSKNKILDFLITYSELDYSLKEIAKYSGAGYSTVKLLIKKFKKDKWVIVARKISKVKLYKLNATQPEVKKFIDFYWQVIESDIKGKDKEVIKEDYKTSAPLGVPVSAKAI